MSKNIVAPKSVSFEDALRNLASRLTGRPAAELPRTQEGIVQFMAENVDELGESVTQEVMTRIKLDELAEAVTREVMARITESVRADLVATEPAVAAQDGAEDAEGISIPPAAEPSQEPAQTVTEPPKPKTTRKTSKARADK